MKWKVLIAHAVGEEELAEKIAEPLRQAGYEVAHTGTVLVGESVVEQASKVLQEGGPVVLCGTVKAVGTGWARRVVNATRRNNTSVRIFPLHMEQDAYLGDLTFDDKAARYWEDPAKAVRDLILALKQYYPLEAAGKPRAAGAAIEQRYRQLALQAFDIIDLANLPESDRHIATRVLELRRLYVPLRLGVERASAAKTLAASPQAPEPRKKAPPPPPGPAVQEESAPAPVGERLKQSRRIVVLGDPGSGKSTLLRWIASAYLLRLSQDPDWKQLPDVATLPEEDWLPILIRCRELGQHKGGASLDDLLRQSLLKLDFKKQEVGPLADLLRSRIEEGRAILLIDGLDEIPRPTARARFAREIEQISRNNQKVAIIASSRIVGYREMKLRISGFDHLVVTDLSPDEKDDFARRWCQLTERPERRDEVSTGLIQDIHSSDRIERLTGNPMLLTTMALVRRKVGKLPSRRTDLYGEAMQVLLNWRSEVDLPLDPYEALPQLQYLAFAMCELGSPQLVEEDVINLFERMRKEYPSFHLVRRTRAKDFLQQLERRTGILVQAGYVRHLGRLVPVYEFRHLTFQEYLAALALVQGCFPDCDPSVSLPKIVAPLAARTSVAGAGAGEELVVAENWREVLRLCVSCCRPPEVDDLLTSILIPLKLEDSSVIARPHAVLAAQCLADEPTVSSALADRIIKAFVDSLNNSDGNGSTRSSADRAAVELAGSSWADKVVHELVDKFRKNPTQDPLLTAGALCGMMVGSQRRGRVQAWFQEQQRKIRVAALPGTLAAALGVMHAAYEGERSTDRRLIDAFFALLKGDAADSTTASWCLTWLNGGYRVQPADQPETEADLKGRWRPSPGRARQIVAALAVPDSPPHTVRFLSWIVRREKLALARLPLLKKLRTDFDSAVTEQVHYDVLRALDALDPPTGTLLSKSLNGMPPCLSAKVPVDEKRVQKAAAQVNLPSEEVRRHYEALASEIDLNLTWIKAPVPPKRKRAARRGRA